MTQSQDQLDLRLCFFIQEGGRYDQSNKSSLQNIAG